MWFVLGGEVLGLFWLIIAGLFYLTIIGIPFGRACLEFAKLSAFPFGKEIIRDTELLGKENVAIISKVAHLILNIIWLIIGIAMTIAYFVAGILSFITIIGIPVGIVYVRMGKFLISPFGARVVSKRQAYASAVANEIESRNRQ
ncbi:MAG: YccF domain-containing protein [Spirochaetia bacterium]